MRFGLAVALLLSTTSRLAATERRLSITCDDVEGTTCVVKTDQLFGGQVGISASTVFSNSPSGIKNLRIESGVTVGCTSGVVDSAEDFCSITLKDFDEILLQGTLVGSTLMVENVKSFEVASTGHVSGDGMGYSSGEGPGAGGEGGCGFVVGASHRGRGGDRSQCRSGTPTFAKEPFGDQPEPTHGSGGVSLVRCRSPHYRVTAPGGGVSRIEVGRLVVDGNITANALACGVNSMTRTGAWCSTGSGGSIWVFAGKVEGSGLVQANGGNVSIDIAGGASGGGGDIQFHTNSNVMLETSLTIEAKGGAVPSASPSCRLSAEGKSGSRNFTCLSFDCSGHGLLKTDTCGCECDSPWTGPTCSECVKECNNGGSPDTSSGQCECACVGMWTGESCSECDSAAVCGGRGVCTHPEQPCNCLDTWFGDNCETFCGPESCKNGGNCTSEGQCQCPFGLECVNGGQVNMDCGCSCIRGWAGDRCNVCDAAVVCNGRGTCVNPSSPCNCNQDWFGARCDTFCDSQDCPISGMICSPQGTCQCPSGQILTDANHCCEAHDCNVAGCPGNGRCENQQCICDAGFVGCSCELGCSDSVTCSGNGKCRFDASCECDSGWIGEDCSEQDPVQYCESGSTISGFPCPPNLLGVLGFGLDAKTGQLTNLPIIKINFKTGRTFKIGEETFEQPDGVSCRAKSRSEEVSSLTTHDSSLKFRQQQSGKMGLGVGFRKEYLSASTWYENILSEAFRQERRLYKYDFEHSLFECEIQDDLNVGVREETLRAVSQLSGNRLAKEVGTHYVKKVVFGGAIEILLYLRKCIFAGTTQTDVKVELELTLPKLIKSASLGGAVSTVGECSAVSSNSLFSKSVEGGDRASLFSFSGEENQDGVSNAWIKTLGNNPGVVRYEVEPIENVLQVSRNVTEAYLTSRPLVKEEILGAVDPNATGCGAVRCAGAAALQTLAASSKISHHTTVVLASVCVGWWYLFW